MEAANILSTINLYPHQKKALDKLKNGSVLCGGVGSGKSIVSIEYYFIHEFPKPLYIITTARKRDTLEWDGELAKMRLSRNLDCSLKATPVYVDSWNNITKYTDVKDSFFIFDEQRVVGSGTWVKSFLKITKSNRWILLSATPGDTWSDYIPLFIANGFYKNKTEFIRRHVVFNRFTKYPKIDHYIETSHLVKLRKSILVNMPYKKETIKHKEFVTVDYEKDLMDFVKKRWDPFMSKPIQDVSGYCYLSRKVANSNLSRLDAVKNILLKKPKVIIFYNFDYELYILRTLSSIEKLEVGEWNGHKHDAIPKSDKWVYLVQYSAGAEGWNCIETDTIIFYSQNYSYKVMLQSAGRIDRINTPYSDLYYIVLKSNSDIDNAISKALLDKKNFNELNFK